jgi:peptidoglycan DL-endopeptidase CwlO
MKTGKIYFLFMCAAVFALLSFSTYVNPTYLKNSKGLPVIDSVKADTAIKYAYKVLGTPYKWAGATPASGFDCSGFVYWVFKHVNVTTARSSKGLDQMGVVIPFEEATRGDVILFTGTNEHDRSVGHVGIVTSKKGEPLTFVHSSSSHTKGHWGVIETVYGGSYYIKRYLGMRRMLTIPANN